MDSTHKDLLSISSVPQLVCNETVHLSATVIKYGNMGFRKETGLAITDRAVYEIQNRKVKSRISLKSIDALTKSSLSSEFVIHVKDEYDVRYISYEFRDEIIETLLYVICDVRKLCEAFPVYVTSQITLKDVMTTPHMFQKRRQVRPPESMLTMMNSEKYKDKEPDVCISPTKKRAECIFNQPQSNSKQVSIDDFELLKVLGQGAFGKVFLARHMAQNKIYAMKVLKKESIIQMDQLEHTKTEKMILQHVNHPFIVGLEFAFQTPDKLYFVMEFMKGGELFNYLSKVGKVSESAAKFYAASVATALGNLHKNNYIYRDLKPENILLDEDGYAKVADFGLARFLKSDEQAHTCCGTPEYVAPEVILGKGHGRPADWWALGIFIHEMLTGTTPFRAKDVQAIYSGIVKRELTFSAKVPLSHAAKDIMGKLLDKNPETRLGSRGDSTDVLSHPWFAEINIPELLRRKLVAPYKPLVKGNDWEKNFGNFTLQKVRVSNGTVDADVLRNYEKVFEDMTFTKTSQP